jgi:hypothetical protein
MMADANANIVHRTFRAMCFDVRVDKTTRYETAQNIGRSDLVLTRFGRGVFCEIKTGVTGFPTKKWTPQQRDWAKWAVSQNGSEIYYFIIIGKHRPNNKKPYYANVMLVPYWEFFRLVIEIEELGRKSIPLLTTAYNTPKDQRGMGLDIITRWGKYALPWGDNVWTIPEDHPFYKFTVRRKNVTQSAA